MNVINKTGRVLWVVFLVIIHVATLGLFVPWWVAVHRRVPNQGSIIVIDIFLGWTLVGWVVAMAMACRSIPRNLPDLEGMTVADVHSLTPGERAPTCAAASCPNVSTQRPEGETSVCCSATSTPLSTSVMITGRIHNAG